ncbi:hypothetical protein [Foetidibacter luteolus]|nr:hypothetical protein [Foetidibacter luteolus]
MQLKLITISIDFVACCHATLTGIKFLAPEAAAINYHAGKAA